MKRLIISLKTSTEVLDDFKKAFRKIKDKKLIDTHFEISFDNKKDFNKFVKNIDILTAVNHFHPKSIYELSKILNKDLSNMLKILKFYEDFGVIALEKENENGREKNIPVVLFERIEFNLAA
jgi:predicted transcriptional regulator